MLETLVRQRKENIKVTVWTSRLAKFRLQQVGVLSDLLKVEEGTGILWLSQLHPVVLRFYLVMLHKIL